MSITSDLIRGSTDTIILACLEKGDCYGYKINKTVSLISEGEYEFKEATLYTAFKRLEDTGCITSYWGEENSGARRRYYTITDKGKRELSDLRKDWNHAKQIIDCLTEGK